MKLIFLSTICCLTSGSLIAQFAVDSVVRLVEQNNKSIQANKKYWQAKQDEYKIGLTPYDPQVEYDYLFGSPVGAGNQKDFSITQRLDFPSAYKQKKELANQQIAQTSLQQQIYRQEILLETKLLTLEIIYLNKKSIELNERLLNTRKLLQDSQKMLEKGDATILDVNKAKLQLLDIKNETALNENQKQALNTKISELNGGTPIPVTDTAYPLIASIPEFEILDSTIEANDPVTKVYEQELNILKKQIAVQKAMNLPKIETGYHSQNILGQSYRGIHAGLTIPLWENKNKMKAAQANLNYAISNVESHRLKHRLEHKQYFDLLDVRLKILQEYKELISSLNNTALLNKALTYGQITYVQYFYDQSFYFSAYDKFLKAEWEYQQALAKLYRFKL